MSYILDALKKLEKERRRGRIPGLTEQDSVVYHSRRRPVWPYILIAVFSLNAALLIWWFLPKNPNNTVMPSAPASLPSAAPASQPLTAPPSLPSSEPAISQNMKKPEVEGSGKVTSSVAAESAAVKQPPVSPPAKDTVYRERLLALRKMLQEDAQKTASSMAGGSKTDNEKQKESEAALQEKKHEVVPDPLPEKKLYKLSELPPSVKSGLPGFSITAFLYSEKPSGRMARINERMMREGQELAPGIRVEEIVADGVILSYRKFHFIVNVK
ncbi:MAG: general secretion pathway protein GspB [Nitrospirae bacterium]|nr:general secretion pathway protein GspB [Nitrospirota bacterium]